MYSTTRATVVAGSGEVKDGEYGVGNSGSDSTFASTFAEAPAWKKVESDPEFQRSSSHANPSRATIALAAAGPIVPAA